MKRTFRPKLGLFYLLFGFPVFFGLQLMGHYIAGNASDLGRYAIWSLLMAATFGLLTTFTKVLDQ